VRIAVIGTGYVGLVTGTCLAESGNEVVGIDKDGDKIAILESGQLPIYEPGLLELVERNRREGRLSFTTDLAKGIGPTQLVFIAVGTPQAADGTPDLANLWAVADAIADHAHESKIIVVKSTVPVGTNRQLARRIQQRSSQKLQVASNPEFLKEGAAVDDFMKPDRVVVGVEWSGDRATAQGAEAAEVLRELYSPFLRTERPFLVMSLESAEMTKYVANAMLATKISFINEMANLCERLGADINQVRRGIGHDARIGFQFLFPGAGYGGSCFPKDVNALIAMGRQVQSSMTMLEAVHQVNEAQKHVLFAKVREHFASKLRGLTLAIWGLAFKPRTDDVREAPSLALVEELLTAGVSLRVHDPEAMANARKIIGNKVTYCDRPYDALDSVDGLAIVTEWQEFRNPNFDAMRRLMRRPVIFDGRNLYDPLTVAGHGFTYHSIGRQMHRQEES
jgi:UDPglucose 6-dehydrogenase